MGEVAITQTDRPISITDTISSAGCKTSAQFDEKGSGITPLPEL